MFSPVVKDQLFELLPEPLHQRGRRLVRERLQRACGSSRRARPSNDDRADQRQHGARHDRHRRGQPAGRSRARSAAWPGAATSRIGYYKDPEKTAATFIEVDGKRYSVPGDFARLELDGTMTLLGRGSQCINSGGEKIYPEEVEAALKAHPKVFDALVVGVADERWGQKVTAVVRAPARARRRRSTSSTSTAAPRSPATRCRRPLHLVDEMPRQPSGKPDYTRAKQVAEGAPR